MKALKSIGWFIFEYVPLGPLAPYWFGMLVGRMPRKVKQ